MVAQLSDLSQAAQPTAFHHLLRELDQRGRLLRVYTQNIDAIEQKSGLSFGVPEFEDKRCKPRRIPVNSYETDQLPSIATHLSSPTSEIPRCIPLHGTLQSMHCQICSHSFPLHLYLPSLTSGHPPQCPECAALEETRQLVGKRARGIGKLRPSVVLYNEAHKNGEGVGEVVKKDLIGSRGRSGADLLLVVGTSLRVPGTKRMVREFSKAVRSRGAIVRDDTGLATPPRRSPASSSEDEGGVMKAVYLNLDFPVPTREWEGVFDAWIQGDAQEFAEMVRGEIGREVRAKEVAVGRKRKRDEDAAAENEEVTADNEVPVTPTSMKPTKPRKPMTPPDSPDELQRPRLFLRIPARVHRQPPPSPPARRLIPEVYITSSPPRLRNRSPKGFQKPKAAEDDIYLRKVPPKLERCINEDHNREQPLPNFIRTVQLGLRGSGA
jgi:NAD-dependent SIR2 family protein deacetylase